MSPDRLGPHDRFEMATAEAGQHPVDIQYLYPHHTRAHDLLVPRLLELRDEFASNPDVDRQAERERVARFFDMDPERSIDLNTGADALTEVIDVFTKPGDKIILFDPALYLYGDIADDSVGGKRKVIRLGNNEVGELEMIIKTQSVSTIILNIPRNPDMFAPSVERLQELAKIADKHNVTVIYDEAFWGYSGAVIERVGDENRLRLDYPRSQSHVIMRDVGKLFADPLPRLAMISMSESAMERGGEQLLRRTKRARFNSGSEDIFVTARILHDPQFPEFIRTINEISAKNAELLQQNLDFPVRYNTGPCAFVDIRSVFNGYYNFDLIKELRKVGLFATLASDYYRGRMSYTTIIRFPLVRSEEELTVLVQELQRRLLSLRRRIEDSIANESGEKN